MHELHSGLRLYRTQLRDAVARDLGRRKTRRFALGVAAPLAAAGAVVGSVLVLTSGPQVASADAAILHHVATALTAPIGTILHEEALVTIPGQTPARYSLWEQTDSPYAYRVIKFGHEGSWDGSSYLDYNPASNTIIVQTGKSAWRAPDDAAADLRSLVQSGQAKIDQETTFNGIPAYQLSVSGAIPFYLNGTVFVARDNYRPLEIQTSFEAGPNAQKYAERIDFTTYEYLRANTANLALLDLKTQHPGAQVISADSTPTTTTSK